MKEAFHVVLTCASEFSYRRGHGRPSPVSWFNRLLVLVVLTATAAVAAALALVAPAALELVLAAPGLAALACPPGINHFDGRGHQLGSHRGLGTPHLLGAVDHRLRLVKRDVMEVLAVPKAADARFRAALLIQWEVLDLPLLGVGVHCRVDLGLDPVVRPGAAPDDELGPVRPVAMTIAAVRPGRG